MSRFHRLAALALRSPIFWGAASSAGFFALVHSGALGRQFFQRYCAGHPVNVTEVVLFFVGMAVLALKALDLAAERQALGGPLLGAVPAGGQSAGEASPLLDRLEALPAARRGDRLPGRLRDALLFVERRQSAEGLDEHLKHLADLDADRAHAGYGLLRLIVWAIPILGFLGTVIGITMAIASLRPNALEESMVEVTGGLGVAFDTTALALALSILLMFVQFYVDRAETGLLAEVDRRAEAELVGRFHQLPSGQDGQFAAVRKLAEAMGQTMEQLVRRQADLWRNSLDAAQQRWAQMAGDAGRQLQGALAASLGDTLKVHGREQAEARRFEETVAGLAAAIHLLTARLADPPPVAGSLERMRKTGQAA